MSSLGRRTPLHPLLLQSESMVHAFGAHLAKYWVPWMAFAGAMVAASIGLDTGLGRLRDRWVYPYDHSWLVLGMTAWLLWRAFRQTPVQHIAPSVAGIGALVVTVLFYSLSEVLDISLGMHVVLPLILLALVTTLAGVGFARVVAVSLGMLYFTIPIWDLTIPALQKITTTVVTTLVSWTGPVAYTVGNVITIPSGSFEIAEGCAGMRYFMVSLAIAAFIGLSWYERWRTRILLFVIAGLAAMASNWIRIYTLILIGDATQMQHYVIAKSHDGYGWLVYVVCLLPVLWFARVLDRRETRSVPPSATAAPDVRIASPTSFFAFGLLAAAILAAPALIRGGDALPEAPDDARVMPFGGSGWIPVSPSANWEPEFRSPYFFTHEALESAGGQQVDLFVARYLSQRPGSKLVSNHNHFSPDWQVTASRPRQVMVDGHARTVLETAIARGNERRLVWQWFMVAGEPVHDRFRAKLLELPALMRGRRDGGALALTARCAHNCDAAAEAMGEVAGIAGGRLEGLATGAADRAPAP